MGPRLASRGNPIGRCGYRPSATLQWGRGSRAAETAGSPTETSATGSPSMGPRFASRGNFVPALRNARRLRPSMGPRLASRGNTRSAPRGSSRSSTFNGAAAREPRKRRKRGIDPWLPILFNGAAVREPRKLLSTVPDIKAVCLQWGRGSRAAETALAGWRRCPAARSSMGPRFASRGNGRARLSLRARSRAFNGAAVREPRKPARRRRG